MTDPLQTALAELFYAAGACTEQDDLRGAELCQAAIQPLMAEVSARLHPPGPFEVILQTYGDRKIVIIKAVRAMRPGLGLKDAKDLVEQAPVVILTTPSQSTAEVCARQLQSEGAQATVQPKAPEVK